MILSHLSHSISYDWISVFTVLPLCSYHNFCFIGQTIFFVVMPQIPQKELICIEPRAYLQEQASTSSHRRVSVHLFSRRSCYQWNVNISHSWTTVFCVWTFSHSSWLFSQPEFSLSHGNKNKSSPITAAFIHCAALSSDCSQFARTKQIQGFKTSAIEQRSVFEAVDSCGCVDVYVQLCRWITWKYVQVAFPQNRKERKNNIIKL